MATRDGASFRDPAGRVFTRDERIFRTVTAYGAAHYEAAQATGLPEKWMKEGKLVATSSAPQDMSPDPEAVYCLEHEAIPFISYPYEWCFHQLKQAAVFHLDLQIEALEHGLVFSDASAYNIQFIGHQPVFIDILSLRTYRDGEFWTGHQQFCEQFLNPLLLRHLFGTAHNAWYRGNLDGIPTQEFAKLLKLRHCLSWNILTNVRMLASLQQSSLEKQTEDLKALGKRTLSKNGYKSILGNLRDWIKKLKPKDGSKTTWSDYADDNSYASDEAEKKKAFVAGFAADMKPALLVDMGCNTGAFAETALQNGTARAIGFDFDTLAVEAAYLRARDNGLPLLPLQMDAVNPSPAQGWLLQERQNLDTRLKADALIALAFLHHLVIGKNIPLEEAVHWLVSLAPQGVIEFVPKNDPMITRMLALREDIFPAYTPENFRDILRKKAGVAREETVSASGRMLFHYIRKS